MPAKYTAPGLDESTADKVRTTLQHRLTALTDLSLTLKHIHWNVVGPHFIAVHEMLDPQYDAVQLMTDELAERIATLGGQPLGTPGAIVENRTWDDYSLNRAPTQEHLAALDIVYSGIIADHRVAMDQFDDLDLVSQDMIIGQTEKLELFHWFVRAHLEDKGGNLVSAGAKTEQQAAKQAAGSKKTTSRRTSRK